MAKLNELIKQYHDDLDKNIKNFQDYIEDNNNLPISEPQNRDSRDKALQVLRHTQQVKESLVDLSTNVGEDA